MAVVMTFEIESLQYWPGRASGGGTAEGLFDPKTLLPLFKHMLFLRTFDGKAIALQRTGNWAPT